VPKVRKEQAKRRLHLVPCDRRTTHRTGWICFLACWGLVTAVSSGDLISRWKLDETAGTVVADAVGGHDALAEGQPAWKPLLGNIGGCLKFDGVDDRVVTVGYQALPGSAARSCTAWVQCDTVGATVMPLVAWGEHPAPGKRWRWYIDTSGVVGLATGGTGGKVLGTTYLCDGRWHHLAVTATDRNGDGTLTVNEIRLYVDGMEEIYSLQGDAPVQTGTALDLTMGCYPPVGQYFKGLLDDVRLYDQALSGKEVFQLYILNKSRYTWPTYMNDNARSGVTSERFDLEALTPGWCYVSPVPPQVAWDGGAPWDAYRASDENSFRLTPQRDFDFVFFVTVVNDDVYFGSSVTDSVHCLEVRTGKEKWFFKTDGPVRYPPTYYQGRLFFGSDDGYLYCLQAATGRLLWKYSPAPNDRLIGNNNNLISPWPIRTGTAVLDDKVYFAAGLTSWQSAYLCSLSVEDGSDKGPGLYRTSGGVTPMGAVMVSHAKIYLLQGRLSPYVFDRLSGTRLGTFSDAGNSGCYALITAESTFVQGYAKARARGYHLREFNAQTRDLIATHSDGRRLIVHGGTAYLLTAASLQAIDRQNKTPRWSVATDCNHCLILAGDVLFAGGDNKVCAYHTNDGALLWTRTVKGKARGLAAVDGRLYVSTDVGRIYMFGPTGLPADFNRDGKVDTQDIVIFSHDFLKSTDPDDPMGVNRKTD